MQKRRESCKISQNSGRTLFPRAAHLCYNKTHTRRGGIVRCIYQSAGSCRCAGRTKWTSSRRRGIWGRGAARTRPPRLCWSGGPRPCWRPPRPRAVWLRAPVSALEDLWQGKDIARHLAGCNEAVLLAVTLGPGVDAQIRRAGVGDVAAGAASDALASALTEQAADQAEATLREMAAAEGVYLTGRYSPGYGDWPIGVQPRIAALLDTARRIGLCVTDTCLMLPRKSVTAALGVSREPVTGYRAGCAHCQLRDKCEYRKRGETCES